MALALTQSPGAILPAQSPIVFGVRDNTLVYTSQSFQYTADLYIWHGTPNDSGSTANYVLNKYPNASGSGIFDFSRFLMSDLSSPGSSPEPVYYKATFNYQYTSGSSTVTGSSITAGTTGSLNYFAYDGYYLSTVDTFNTSLQLQPNVNYPFLSDSTFATQSVYADSTYNVVGYLYAGQNAPTTQSLTYTGHYTGGSTQTETKTVLQSTNTSGYAGTFPLWPSSTNFPLSSSGLLDYSISSGSISLNFEVECGTKYENHILRFKNRYGVYENLPVNYNSIKSFAGTQKTYRPQKGDWNSTTFSYNTQIADNQKYQSDGSEIVVVNTGFLDQNYNRVLEQLLVSDDVYLIEESTSTSYPVELITNSLQLKTGITDKLIQYTFQVRKNNYKLVL